MAVQIPRFYSAKGLPGQGALVPVSPKMTGAEAEAWEGVGGQVEKLGEEGFRAFRKLEEAAETEKILNIHYDMKDEFGVMADRFKERRDYDKFDDDFRRESEIIRGRYGAKVTSKDMQLAFDKSFRSMTSDLKGTLLHQKARIITENALGAFNRTYDGAVGEYIASNDERVRRAIKMNLELEAQVLVSRNIMKPTDADNLIGTFDAKADEAQVRTIGVVDPLKAYGLLMEGTKFPNIDPIKRAQLIEHMEVRVRMEEGRIDKLNTAVQRENQAYALNDWATGRLDYDRLLRYRAFDPETGQPGLSDAFFTSMLDRIRYGKDVITNPKTFASLYLAPDLTRRDIDSNADELAVSDQRILLGRILQEGREDERDSRRLRQEKQVEERREEAVVKKEEADRIRIEKERRNHYASDARAYMKKAFNEYDIKADEGGQMLRVFQGYIDDPKIPPEELVEYAQKVIETRKGGVIRQLWNWMFPNKAKEELQRIPPAPPPSPPKPAIPSAAGTRKSLDDIFGGPKK